MRSTEEILDEALAAKRVLADLTTEKKNAGLLAMADALVARQAEILAANQQDVEAAKGVISPVMIDRLQLSEKRIADMADGIRAVAELPDPVGEVRDVIDRPNGLHIEKQASAMGVIAIIYESRPNVTSDAAALCLKAGSVCVLRSGKEAHRSAMAIVEAMRAGLQSVGLSKSLICLIEDTSRASADALMHADGFVDLLIPRGGAGLIRACVEHATVPCIQTGTGICHVYVDAAADLQMAVRIVENAKTSRPSVCNAEEVLLVHKDVAAAFLPMAREALVTRRKAQDREPVELRLDERASAIIPGTQATPKDFDTEFLDYILAVKVVDSLSAAIRHISVHSTHHSDAIVTEDKEAAARFVREVDSAAVYVNCSTRFTDGGEFGLGCEMGISTQKLHARGPMGLRELCTCKYVITGDGQVR